MTKISASSVTNQSPILGQALASGSWTPPVLSGGGDALGPHGNEGGYSLRLTDRLAIHRALNGVPVR
jgi:hypothetical protein